MTQERGLHWLCWKSLLAEGLALLPAMHRILGQAKGGAGSLRADCVRGPR